MSQTKVTLYFNSRPTFDEKVESHHTFYEVGHFSIDDRLDDQKLDVMLNDVFDCSQNLTRTCWTQKNRLIQSELDKCRSTSVGDLIKVGTAFYVVSDYGFRELHITPNII